MAQQVSEQINQAIKTVKQQPPWRLYGLIALLILALVYLGWSLWGKRPQPPAAGFVATQQAVKAEKAPGPTVTLRVVPKEAVQRKYPNAHVADPVVVVDTADIPAAPNGATAITTVDPATGEAKTEVQTNAAPWFAFERNNTIGAGYEIGSQGGKVPIYYKRDILRVRDVHLVGEIGAKVALNPAEKSEAHATALVEWRF